MKITFESGTKSLTFDCPDFRKVTAAKHMRSFGLWLTSKVNELEPDDINLYVKLKDHNKEYWGLIYTPVRYLVKARAAVTANKKCPTCGRTILCACHDNCCDVSCETSNKTAIAISLFSDRILKGMYALSNSYTDEKETAADGS